MILEAELLKQASGRASIRPHCSLFGLRLAQTSCKLRDSWSSYSASLRAKCS